MSDKQLALDSIERLPENVSLDVIAERLEFLAAVRKGLDRHDAAKPCRTRKSNGNWRHGLRICQKEPVGLRETVPLARARGER